MGFLQPALDSRAEVRAAKEFLRVKVGVNDVAMEGMDNVTILKIAAGMQKV